MQSKPQPDENINFGDELYVVGITDKTSSEPNTNESLAQRDPDEMELGVEGRSVLKSIFEFK